ncbi:MULTISPECIES: AIPR family protein [Exiguobacterium]|uniref:AIPR family protein n=1 Tax=Exiguobacterium TaxID=33986 RepID=UPI001BE514D5|nr:MULTISPECIES: AIPR family protein [Exiguobacterium]MCT4776686.1 AIPR family protein [Exiguobacterium aquaticum]MCT4788707.1 AIPR family protein [Exiguobacterium mexicanum]
MGTIIQAEINKIIEFALSSSPSIELSEEQAFNVLMLQYYSFKEADLQKNWHDIKLLITDGKDDGGVDAIYFDEDDSKIVLFQNKYSSLPSAQDAVSEISKVINTLENFMHGHTGSYNNKVQKLLQESLDRLSEDNEGNIEVVFSSFARLNEDKVKDRLMNIEERVAYITVFNDIQIEAMIEKLQLQHDLIIEDSIKIDEASNYLEYSNEELEGIFVNVSSRSVSSLYNKYNQKGLFNLNIRKYIRNKNVDDGITRSLNNNRQDFWFLNNGLTIACTDFTIDGDKIKLYNFSIVNGGQTTTLIGKYKGTNKDEFYIPCKIVSYGANKSLEDSLHFFNNIAEATNSQKPIQPKDLKSNAPEMRSLQNLLKTKKVFLEIKRGEIIPRGMTSKVKNDELAQLIFSFVNQKPGTARSNKNALFNNNKFYKQIFNKKYSKDVDKADFLIDLIKLNDRFTIIQKEFKNDIDNEFDANQANVFNNGKFVLFALFGLAYRILNSDVDMNTLKSDPGIVDGDDFVYGKFLSNYDQDDIDQKIKDLLKFFVEHLENEYRIQFAEKNVTSVSNFFKTDKKYQNDIIISFAKKLSKTRDKNDLYDYGAFLKRD